MARNNGAAPAPSKTPKYTVVRVNRKSGKPGGPLASGDSLTVLADGIEAKQPLMAVDVHVDSLPSDQRGGEFGAISTRGFTSDEYVTETVVETRRKGGRTVSKAAQKAATAVSV